MIERHFLNFRTLRKSQLFGGLQVIVGVLVVPRFEFTQSQKGPSGTNLGVQFDHLTESGKGFCKVVAVIEQGSEIPPAFVPVRAKFQGGAIVANGPIDSACLSVGRGISCPGLKAL